MQIQTNFPQIVLRLNKKHHLEHSRIVCCLSAHLIAMVQSVVTVSPWCPRGLVTIMVHRMTVPAPDAPIAVKTPVHVAVEILKLFKRF